MEKGLIREQISNLEKKIIELQNEKQALEIELKQADQEISILPQSTTFLKQTNNFTPEEKIKIFHQLFRGRNDVYAHLWISSKTGRKGYSPACKNEWVPKVCRKSALKCSECPNREYLPRMIRLSGGI